MKKKTIRLIGISMFALVLFFNLSLSFDSNSKTKTELKNMEALACYSVESGDTYIWDCCYPWIPFCYVESGLNFNGTISF